APGRPVLPARARRADCVEADEVANISRLWTERFRACGIPRAVMNREFQVRNSIAHGWHVASRTAILQTGATLVAALAATGFGWRTGLAALVGGLIVCAGNMLFALRLFGRGVVSPRAALRSAYAGELLKWLWLGGTLYL